MRIPFIDRIQGALIFLSILALLVWLNHPLLVSKALPVGDYAADMLLGNTITREGVLLFGHYSRWQFNHPGPFWLYLNHGFEWMLGGLDLTRLQVWVIGSVLINAVLMTGGSLALSKFLFNRIHVGYVIFFASFGVGFSGAEICSIWMPWRIVTPYLCFLIAILHLTVGNYRAIWPACFLTGVLIHGYVTMPIFTLPFLLWGVGAALWRKRFIRMKGLRVHLIGGVVILSVMALPILIEAMSASPTNFSRIMETQSLFRGMAKPGVLEILQFASSLLKFEEKAWGWVAAFFFFGVFVCWRAAGKVMQHRIIWTWCFSGFVLLYAVVYYGTTPAPLYTFVGQFLVSIPILILGAAAAVAFASETPSSRQSQYGSKYGMLKATLLLVTVILLSDMHQSNVQDPGDAVKGIADALTETAGLKSVRLDYSGDQGWSLMAGLILEIDRRGGKVCTTRRDSEWVFTKFHLCSPEMIPEWELVEEAYCGELCLYHGGGYGLRRVRLPILLPQTSLKDPSSHAIFLNWTEAPKGSLWTSSTAASLVFEITDPSRFEGILDLNFSTLGSQRVIVAWNGRTIYSNRITQTGAPLRIRFPVEWIRPGPNSLSFEVPDARRFGPEDQRTLALRFNEIVIR